MPSHGPDRSGAALALALGVGILATTLPLRTGLPGRGLAAQEPACPAAAAPGTEAGWAAYRRGDVAVARGHFETALERCPRLPYALTGLGYVLLREGADDAAAARFEAALEGEPGQVDALVGLGLVAWRAGDLDAVRERFLAVQAVAPDDPTAADYLGRLPPGLGPPPERPSLVRPDTLVMPARTVGEGFQVRGPDGAWRPFHLMGVNLGAALPGRNPSEFPDSATYTGWIEGMAEMGANAVRVYTLHPPHFYRALAAWNEANPDALLWLVHGVWTELPDDHDYLSPEFEDGFFAEMERVVDVIHGRADLRPRPGHASGFYTADVSRWTMAWIIGREWEPFSSEAFEAQAPDFTAWPGELVALDEGTPMEAWLAKAVDHMASYEFERYGAQRPIAYTNWPTLDPLLHVTESTREEEVELRETMGEEVRFQPREYNNDLVQLDATRMRATPAFEAGVFASFHAYPYYPDFMILEPDYAGSRSRFGPSRYFGYLQALKAAHPGMPVVIGEYGVPASHGPAHLQPEGRHHGGLTEAEMAEVNRRMTVEIADAGLAGGALFAWIDEWFKRNWLTLEFALPPHRNRLWHNKLDAEQNYGMLASEPVPPVPGTTLEERLEAWRRLPALASAGTNTLRAAADPAYLWLLVETPGRGSGEGVRVALDILDPEAGDTRWPGGAGPTLPTGAEFVVVDDGAEVRVLADPPVNPFRLVPEGEDTRAAPGVQPEITDPPPGFFRGRVGQRFNLPYITVANADGVYDSLRVVPNRRRVGRDSLEYLALGYDRGVLRPGPPPDGLWERRGDALEIRIPWLLINVSDPSSRSVLASPGAAAAGYGRTPEGLVRLPDGRAVPPDTLTGELEVRRVPDIGVVAARDGGEDGVWVQWPQSAGGARFTWPTWDVGEISWRARPRPVVEVMRRTFAELSGGTATAAPAEPEAPGPDTLASLLQSGDAAWQAGETDAALIAYEAALAVNPGHPLALHRSGLLHAWREEYQVALERLRRLLALQPERLDVRIDVARIEAWRGDLDAAIRRLDGILAEHPGTPAALDARGTFQAWAGRYDAALGSYDELLAISPEGGEVQRQRATVLAWASDYEASLAVWDSLLAVDPDDAEALRGRGRVLSWQGRLLAAERTLRRALDVEPKSVEGRVLLGQNLRWQGRPAAALDVLVEARELDPGDGDARAQLRLVEAALAPRASPRMVVEGDSDDNRMLTSLLTTAWHPLPRLGVRLDLYQRWLDQGELGASASGFSLAADWQLPPGWTVAAGVGQSRNDGGRRETIDGWRASVASPGRHPLRATLVAQRRALDATALLARVGVTLEEVELEASWSPAPPWRVNGALSRATFDGTRENTRTGTALAVTRRVGRPWTFGAAVRGFSFERDLADGYFDPDRYDIAELTARWLWEPGAWSLRAEGAPGVQRVGAAGDPAGTLRLSGRVALRLAPGRELSFSAGYSSTGLQSFSTGDSDYRYLALVLGASWVF